MPVVVSYKVVFAANSNIQCGTIGLREAPTFFCIYFSGVAARSPVFFIKFTPEVWFVHNAKPLEPGSFSFYKKRAKNHKLIDISR
jgi:hypothetical protein